MGHGVRRLGRRSQLGYFGVAGWADCALARMGESYGQTSG